MCLKKLELRYEDIYEDNFRELIENCPKLEELSVIELGSCVELIIEGPSLKKLDICSDFLGIEICAPNLVTFEVGDFEDATVWKPNDNNNGSDNFVWALGSIPEVEKMSLGSYFLSYLSYSNLELDFNFPKLKELQLEVNFDDEWVAVIVLILLELSPNLEKLDISMHIAEQVADHEIINFWSTLNLEDYWFENLRLVTIDRFEFEPVDVTLAFIETILACSPNLQKFHIIEGNLTHEESDEQVFLERLPNLVKASVNAEVVFEREEDSEYFI